MPLQFWSRVWWWNDPVPLRIPAIWSKCEDYLSRQMGGPQAGIMLLVSVCHGVKPVKVFIEKPQSRVTTLHFVERAWSSDKLFVACTWWVWRNKCEGRGSGGGSACPFPHYTQPIENARESISCNYNTDCRPCRATVMMSEHDVSMLTWMYLELWKALRKRKQWCNKCTTPW